MSLIIIIADVTSMKYTYNYKMVLCCLEKRIILEV